MRSGAYVAGLAAYLDPDDEVQLVDEHVQTLDWDDEPGRHVYFLDDHLFDNPRFGEALFAGMKGMSRVFQGASTVNAILQTDLIERPLGPRCGACSSASRR